MCDRRHREERAFTLLEVMVALAVLSIALVVVLKNSGKNLSLMYEANSLTIADFLARQKISELELGLGGTKIMEGQFGQEFPGYQWKAEVLPSSIPLSQVQLLQIKIIWKEGEREKSYTLSQYVGTSSIS
jgi:general secretion pathway protein I